ncbi:MAG: MBL fold metallo-hydrolase [Phototrophicales bacterium]|nr:MBL fold metallo-hydrolase [Phototrophicales bacterium]
MKITFLGGADEVGASSTLIEIAGKRILVDAGIRISPKTNRGIQNDQLPDLHPISVGGGLDYLLVTHAHTDHTGALPLVVEQYPHVPVLATRPTQVLTRILQADAQRIMKSKQEEEGELPIFDEIASQRLLDTFQTVEFNQPIRLGEGLQVTYHVAGHIVGAAMLVFESEEGTLVISGDVSLNQQRAVLPAKTPRIKADALVLESTYGGRLHANRDAEEKRIIASLKAVIEGGGKALIPAFALGRAQEVLQIVLAYRDQLDVPIYADGMVRAVCNGYATFPDLLPPNTVKMAGDKHLFFREKVKAIQSNAERDAMLADDAPAVIIASSGMLTGGASAMYAKKMAGNPKNAIFLTGYQDEEAPGKMLQRLIKARDEGDGAGMIKIDGQPVTVRCMIDTYSLSAHADEAELVSIAEALDADEIMLVHGDPSARHSLATRLRQRGRRVITPRIGQTEHFSFPKRPWGIARVATGNQTDALNAQTLWESLKSQVGNFFSARELAQMWWGDGERAGEVIKPLANSLYFAQDWRRKDTFQVRTAEQIEKSLRSRAFLLAHPDLIGKLVVLRDTNNRPHIAVVVGASEDTFEAEVQGAKGRQYAGDALLWVIGNWEREMGVGMKTQLNTIATRIKVLQDVVLPFHIRQRLVADAKPILPERLIPNPLPDGVTALEALAAIVMGLAYDGASVEQGGLLPKRALQDGPVEQNVARDMALEAFPPEARLRKVGMEIHRKRLMLTFDFPERAVYKWIDHIDQLEETTGWEVHTTPTTNQQALGDAVYELLPKGARLVKGVSYYMDKREVVADIADISPETLEALKATYLDLTGFKLMTPSAVSGGNKSANTVASPSTTGHQMEINATYGLIRSRLDGHGLYKASLKGGGIVLSFISPQVGERYREVMNELSVQTGYAMSIHPHPNQQEILTIANRMVRELGWSLKKGIGIHTDRAEIGITLMTAPDDVTVLTATAEFLEQTGYLMVVTVG